MNLYQMIFKRRSIRKFKYEAVPEQLLKDIIADLVGGTFTHGSDERMYADQWFRRCYMFPDKTFIRYLIIRDKVDELLEDYEKLREYQNDYVQMQKSPDVYELDEVMATQKEIEVLSAYIKEIYESYLKSLDDELPEGSLEEVISNVQVWNDKRPVSYTHLTLPTNSRV